VRSNASLSKAIEANHHITLTANIGPRAVALLVDERVALQELVQRILTAVASIDLIGLTQLADG